MLFLPLLLVVLVYFKKSRPLTQITTEQIGCTKLW